MHDPSIAPRLPLAGLRRKNARPLDRPSFACHSPGYGAKRTTPRSQKIHELSTPTFPHRWKMKVDRSPILGPLKKVYENSTPTFPHGWKIKVDRSPTFGP
jgi:hypothetical protein